MTRPAFLYLISCILYLLSPSAFCPSAFAADVAPQPGDQLIDRIVAVVDGHPILYSEVQNKVEKGPLVVVSEFPATQSSSQYDQALQDAINFELVLAKAKDLEIDVRDDEVESEIKSFLESRGLNRDGLLEHLRQAGMSYEDYKRDFKDQMILRRFQGRVIAPLIKITDKDVETYYLKKTAGSTADLVELVLRQCLIAVPSGATPDVVEAKKKLAQEVHQKITDGMAFAEAVKIYSDEPNARQNGGLMEPVKASDLAPGIKEAVEKLEPGQFTQPVKSPLGYHLFYLEEKKFSGSEEFQAKKKELEMELRNEELQTQTRRWLGEQRQKSKVEILGE